MSKRIVKLCSACLLGIDCRYDGQSQLNQKILGLAANEILIPVCPEQLGGLPTPRVRAERKGNRVVTESGDDVTGHFEKGARQVLKLAEIFGCSEAIFKQRSPSCGSGLIYGGTFSGNVVEGDGVTTKLLKKNGISVITEEDL